jgi:hypothetical protein
MAQWRDWTRNFWFWLTAIVALEVAIRIPHTLLARPGLLRPSTTRPITALSGT